MKDFVKRDDADFVQQLETFSSGLAEHGAVLGFSPEEIEDAAKDVAFFRYILNLQYGAHNFAKSTTAYKVNARYGKGGSGTNSFPVPTSPSNPPQAMPGNLEKRFRQRVARAKNSLGYGKNIGARLGILMPESDFKPNEGKPVVKASLKGGRPQLKWKKGNFEGVEIWADYGNGWVKVQRHMRSPFVDKQELPASNQPALWKYKMVYVLKDERAGNYSNEVSVVVRG